MANILVVDDDRSVAETVARLLHVGGHAVAMVGDGGAAVAHHQATPVDLVVLDLMLPGLSGEETFARLRAHGTPPAVVFLTGHGTIRSAVAAVKAGADNYLTKPFENEALELAVAQALERRGLRQRVATLEADLAARDAFPDLLGRSPVLMAVIRDLAKFARTGVSVLIVGETGTGKEHAARGLHRASERAQGPWVPVNCGAIATSVAESLLFGHQRGAFTDAKEDRSGYFEQAGGGTIFLDEIGDLAPELQVKFLRVLQEGEVTRLGATRARPIDTRVIAATNRPLLDEVRSGRFREDLYYRLAVATVTMPPLRERPEDIPLLATALLDRANVECRTHADGLTPSALRLLQAHRWPGNIRELWNAMRHAAALAEAGPIDVVHLPREVQAVDAAASSDDTLHATLAATEIDAIRAALARHAGNRTAAAASLGISRQTLHAKLKALADAGQPID
jgi:DNA-binding NtrC family response regulator